jgi:hypothetical protein
MPKLYPKKRGHMSAFDGTSFNNTKVEHRDPTTKFFVEFKSFIFLFFNFLRLLYSRVSQVHFLGNISQ